jgi:hypothetical protein
MLAKLQTCDHKHVANEGHIFKALTGRSQQ